MTIQNYWNDYVTKQSLLGLFGPAEIEAIRCAYFAGFDAAGEEVEINLGPGGVVDNNEIVEHIYNAYPRKVGKTAAIKAIKKAVRLCNAPFNLLSITRAYASCVAKWPKEERKYCPHPATWFNQGRYDDDPSEWVRDGNAMRKSGRVSASSIRYTE